jgi:delta(3,5)-delta(2,4)-dienoyl-CoA isomerase
MWLDLERIFDKLSNDANVRCVVLSGAGDRAFTTGLDVGEDPLTHPLWFLT